MMKLMESTDKIDKIGIGLSSLCMVHCLVTPILILFMPVVQNELLHSVFHRVMFVLVVLIAMISFLPSYKKHKQMRVLVYAAIGCSILMTAAADFHFIHHIQIPYFEHIFTSIGGIFLLTAHISNIRCVHKSCKH